MDDQTPRARQGDERALHHIEDRIIAGSTAHIAGTTPTAVAAVIDDLQAVALLHGVTLSVSQGDGVMTVRVDWTDLSLIPDEIQHAA